MALDKLVWGAVDDSVPHQFELCSDLAAVCKGWFFTFFFFFFFLFLSMFV
jgi:hypothetical protein